MFLHSHKYGTGMAKLVEYPINNVYKWFVIYTRINYEKNIEKSLEINNIDVYLPKRKTLRMWSDRKKRIEEPVFSGYLFVRGSNLEYHKVLQIPYVFGYICFGSIPARVPDNQIEMIKRVVENGVDFDISHERIRINQVVEFYNGPFKGLKGTVKKKKGKDRLIIYIEAINCSMLVDVERKCVKQDI